MSIGNVEHMYDRFQKHLLMATAIMIYDKEKKISASMERSKEGTKEKKSPDGLSLPNPSIIISITCIIL